MINIDILENEKKKLIDTQHEMQEVLIEEKQRLAKLPSSYAHDPRLLASLLSMVNLRIQNLTKGLEKPYFARIDFREHGKLKDDILYIGKVGVFNRNSDVIVTDWRAPVSSIYYDGQLGKISYIAPMGKIEGNLSLKRQIIIENKNLINFFDVDSVSDDELLKPYLGASADSRLKNIVASIQSEQNDIIRKDLYNNVITQGVAGSGKTTVALHRIAYLVYNYQKTIAADKFLVIGPNKFFINYISSVLPDLDVGNASQLTYEELAKKYIDEKFDIKDSTQTLIDIVNGKSAAKHLKLKTSMVYKGAIDNFKKDIETLVLPKEGFSMGEFEIFKRDEIINEFKEATISTNIESRLSKVVIMLSSRLKRDKQIPSDCKRFFDEKLKGLSTQDTKFSGIYKSSLDTRKKIEEGAVQELKKYLSVKSVKVLTLYKYFIENIEKYINSSVDKLVIQTLKKDTLFDISKKNVAFEDVPALMYLKYIVFGEKEYENYAHTVVDEAQDFGTFNFYILKEILSKSTFSIFGDITQGIHSYRGISNWEEVNEAAFQNKASLMNLEKSYRTTIEIMEAANNISMHLGLGAAKPVIRHGEKVKVSKVSKDDKVKYIVEKINNLKSKDYKSIAVICKTPDQSRNVYNQIKDKLENVSHILGEESLYNGGICVLTSYLAKGLEFDGVIVYDASETSYSSKNETEMKLLYVAMTRALHELDLLYEVDLTMALKNV